MVSSENPKGSPKKLKASFKELDDCFQGFLQGAPGKYVSDNLLELCLGLPEFCSGLPEDFQSFV